MSTIAAGTTSGTALVSTGNTDGTLQLQVNGTTPSITLAANGSIGVGSTPGYGTNGQVLTSAGTGAAPTWTTLATPPASGLTLLSTVTASAAATADIETTFNSTYDNYLLIGTVTPSSNGQGIEALMKIGGTYVTTGYMSHTTLSQSSSSTYLGTSGATTYFYVATGTLNTAAASANFQMTIYNPSSTVLAKQVSVIGVNQTDATTVRQAYTAALNTGTAALTGIRIYAPVGTITGTFRLYGIAKS